MVKSRYSAIKREHEKLSEEAKTLGLDQLATQLGIDKLSFRSDDIVKKYLI